MENIDDIQLGLVKFRANAEKYFSLFDKHIPRFENSGKDRKFLLLGICNESVMLKICALNPKAKYYIADQEILSETLPLLDKNLDFKFYDSNLELYDIIKGIDMKFDCIIMNPPYQRNLHLKILAEAIKHLKDEKSVCVNLSPDNWLMKHNLNNPIGKYRIVFSNDILDIEVIPHDKMNELFNTGNSIEEGCILTVSNGNGKLDLKHYGFNSKAEYSLYSKVSKFKDGVLSIHKAVGVSGRACYGKSNKPYSVGIYGWHGGKDCKETVVCEDSKQPYITLFFNSENKRKNFLNSLDTLFMNWYCKAFIEPGNYIVKNHFFIMQDYSKPWDDARFYKFFNITPEEQKLIEDTMKKYEVK